MIYAVSKGREFCTAVIDLIASLLVSYNCLDLGTFHEQLVCQSCGDPKLHDVSISSPFFQLPSFDLIRDLLKRGTISGQIWAHLTIWKSVLQIWRAIWQEYRKGIECSYEILLGAWSNLLNNEGSRTWEVDAVASPILKSGANHSSNVRQAYWPLSILMKGILFPPFPLHLFSQFSKFFESVKFREVVLGH